MNEIYQMRARLLNDTPLFSHGTMTAMILALQEKAVDTPFEIKIKEMLTPKMEISGGIATIPVGGVMMHKPSAMEMYFFGAEDTQNISRMAEEATRNPEIKGVLLDVDSGGGMLTGTPEAADAIETLAKRKPVVTFTDGLMASAAYWLGSRANAIVATKSAQVGSIGVYISFADYSRYLEAFGVRIEVIKNKEGTYKAMGMTGTTLTDAQREYLQERVDRDFKNFSAEVQRARGKLDPEIMRGQTFSGQEAKSVGLIDRVGGKDFARSLIGKMIRGV